MLPGRLIGTGTLVVLDGLPSVPDQPAQKLTLSADATWYRDSRAGSHELQGGVYIQPLLRERSTTHYANGGFALEEVVLRDPSNAASGFVPFHRQIFDLADVPFRWADSHDYAAYAQDAWRPVPRLTVNAGVRVDVIDRNDAVFNVETMRTEIGPRFGVNYLLTKDGRDSRKLGAWPTCWRRRRNRPGRTCPAFAISYDTNLDGTFETTFVTPGVSAVDRSRAGRRPPPAVHG